MISFLEMLNWVIDQWRF